MSRQHLLHANLHATLPHALISTMDNTDALLIHSRPRALLCGVEPMTLLCCGTVSSIPRLVLHSSKPFLDPNAWQPSKDC